MPEYGKPIDNNLHWKSTLDFFKDASLEKVSQFSPKEKQELEDDDTAMGADYPQDPDTANAPKSAAPIVDGGFKEEARRANPIEESLLKLMKYQYSPEEIPSRKYEYPSRDDRPDLHAHQSGGLNMPEYNPDIPANPSPDEQQRIRNVSQLAEGVGKRYGEGKGQGVLDASKITPEMVEDQRVSDAFKRDVSRYSEKNPNNHFKNSVENCQKLSKIVKHYQKL